MEGNALFGELKVLIVDPSEDTSEVLRLVLEKQGFRAVVAATLGESTAIVERFRPDVIVVDEEADQQPAAAAARQSFVNLAQKSGAKILVLGRLRLPEPLENGSVAHLGKPYHYHQLVGKINEIAELVAD